MVGWIEGLESRALFATGGVPWAEPPVVGGGHAAAPAPVALPRAIAPRDVVLPTVRTVSPADGAT
ncbi:MAG TPA: hypothetical protein VF796_00905, partial [Humisphaera sp.]